MTKKFLLLFVFVIFIWGCSKETPETTDLVNKNVYPLFSSFGVPCISDASLKDISQCGMLDSEKKFYCIYNVASIKKDSNICNQLNPKNNDPEPVYDCYGCVAGVKKDISVCQGIPKQIPAVLKALCYFPLAQSTQDLTICDSIPHDSDELGRGKNEACYGRVAGTANDIKICNKFTDQKLKTACYKSVARVNKDASVCDSIPGQETEYNGNLIRDECYLGVVYETNDSEICSKIEIQSTKDFCYLYIARAKQDESICNKIGIENKQNPNSPRITKDSCYSIIQKIDMYP